MALGKIKADTLEHSTAGSLDTKFVVNGSAKAWVNLDGTGTIAISDSFNVTSATDNGTGNYTITITNSMSNTVYTVSGGTTPGASGYTVLGYESLATGSYIMKTSDGGTSQEDKDPVTSNLHGDLA
jgi:hypothetical protein